MADSVSLSEVTVKQCQNCFVRESGLKEKGQKLLTCGACKRASYCSPECQRLHWKAHKPFCLMNRQADANSNTKTVIDPHRLQTAEVESHYKQWILVSKSFFSNSKSVLVILLGVQEYRPILFLSVFYAFELEQHPENISQNILIVTLSPTFLPGQKKVDPKRSFNVVAAGVESIAEFPDLQVRATAEQVFARVPELQRRDPTVLGFGIIYIIIPYTDQETIRHIVPWGPVNEAQTSIFELVPPVNPNWKNDLIMCVRNGTPVDMLIGRN
ncbi:hypothetical protein EST38_g9213 [Candolleomyces aberdarensis]|uniref:MYND-type domain-containing protein n=1 Tax=Candolleomyces aberdarensis TaxID=2316362 RepID=A0A4Q2DAI7_9AGAR|nr:hypothetical protein EST38_g9213 [Candolleomyces aberdarensis]